MLCSPYSHSGFVGSRWQTSQDCTARLVVAAEAHGREGSDLRRCSESEAACFGSSRVRVMTTTTRTDKRTAIRRRYDGRLRSGSGVSPSRLGIRSGR